MEPRLAPIPTHPAGVPIGADVAAAFRASGVLRLRSAIPRPAIEHCRHVIWHELLAADGVARDPSTWPDVPTRQAKALGRRPEFWFDDMDDMRQDLDELLGSVHGEPGDIVLMAGWTIHAAPPRIAPRPRLIHVGGATVA